MPNHVHLIAVPDSESGLRASIGEAHKRYTRMVNSRESWKGHLWQGRFFSYPLDESYLLTVARYIEMNPVRTGLIASPGSYLWSSAQAHFAGRDDELVTAKPLLDRVDKWDIFLHQPVASEDSRAIKKHEKTGRPLGNSKFLTQIEMTLKRRLQHQKPGPKSKQPIH
jgi:putative transposase